MVKILSKLLNNQNFLSGWGINERLQAKNVPTFLHVSQVRILFKTFVIVFGDQLQKSGFFKNKNQFLRKLNKLKTEDFLN